jgi:hypothetical protein
MLLKLFKHVAETNMSRFVNLLTAFTKLLLFKNVPVDMVMDFFFSQEYDQGAGRAHMNKDVDSHVLTSAPICALFFFARGLQVLFKLD